MNKTENLHGAWDYGLIDNIVSRNYSDYHAYASAIVSSIIEGDYTNLRNWTDCVYSDFPCPDEWAQESSVLACNYAYVNSDGKTPIESQDYLDVKYLLRVEDTVTEQLAKSGYRMAAVINAIVGEL
jgi:hypothetical protein